MDGAVLFVQIICFKAANERNNFIIKFRILPRTGTLQIVWSTLDSPQCAQPTIGRSAR